MTPTPVSYSPARNQPKLAGQSKSTAFYMTNAVILRINSNIYVLWSVSTKRETKRATTTTGRAGKKIGRKFQKFVKNKKRRKTEKELQHFQEMQISDNESKKNV